MAERMLSAGFPLTVWARRPEAADDLVAKGAVRPKNLVKVLGTGELSVKLDVTVDAWSNSAKAKIEAAGGSVTAREA